MEFPLKAKNQDTAVIITNWKIFLEIFQTFLLYKVRTTHRNHSGLSHVATLSIFSHLLVMISDTEQADNSLFQLSIGTVVKQYRLKINTFRFRLKMLRKFAFL